MALHLALEVGSLLAGYAAVDSAVRRRLVETGASAVGVGASQVRAGIVMATLGLSPFWTWSMVPDGAAVRWLAVALASILVWRAATRDIDIVVKDDHPWARRVLIAATVAIPWSPAMVVGVVYLLSSPFRIWQHHATLPMRALQALVAYLGLSALPWASVAVVPGLFADASGLVFFILVIQVSHYLITALAKGLLGPHWYSWVFDNKIHHLAASAYSWGWARFIPWPHWKRIIDAVKRIERPLQGAAFAIELLAPLALLDRRLAIAFCIGWAGFHLGVFALSGLLFWEWVLTDLLMAAVVWHLAPDTVFGPGPTVLGTLVMVAFPLRHKLWKPMPLGWWDTPLTQRIRWEVEGESGTRYGLYNDFMCPHERLYGKVHGCFLSPRPVMTYHLGEVWKHDLRDAIRDAGPDLTRLQGVRDRFGIDPRHEGMALRHEAYLRAFFAALDRGARKHVLPSGLRFIKAPGGQLFGWGELPAFTGQERARRVRIFMREEFFDGERLVRLTDELVADYDLRPSPDSASSSPPQELTPKQIDDYLLGLAQGRLIDLPGFGEGYANADDGVPTANPTS
ncbi:MAG: hypothetical protein AAGA56_08010 [Myxococcota bacterium]